MIDPSQLLDEAAKAVAKAVGNMVVHASAPVIQRVISKARPAPAIVKRFDVRKEARLAHKQQLVIENFLLSRECTGLLELLAFLEYDKSGHWEHERDVIRQTFGHELRAKLTLDNMTAARVIDELWTVLADNLRLTLDWMTKETGFSNLNYMRTMLQGRNDDSIPLLESIAQRSSLAGQGQRVAAAHGLVTLLKQTMHVSFSKLHMPHARENYRVDIGSIYVHRNLAPQNIDVTHGAIDALRIAHVPDYDFRDRRAVIVGNPGAGKTTFVRYLMYWLGRDESTTPAEAPILLELKRYPGNTDYLAFLARNLTRLLHKPIESQTISDLLVLGYGAVVFDGLDEIPDVEARRNAAEEIESFARRFPLSRVIVTSRQEGYLTAALDPTLFSAYRLPDYTNKQVATYCLKWFRLVSDKYGVDPHERVKAFLADSVHVEDLRANPLMLSLLCLLYEYDGWIPENRLQVYEDCATLLFQRWDRMRHVPVSVPPKTQMWHLFQELAYHLMFEEGNRESGATEKNLRSVIQKFFARNSISRDASASAAEASDFLEFCSGRAWLLNRVGTNSRGERLYDFAHRTFMEYFAACYFSRQSVTADSLAVKLLPIIQERKSGVVAQLALQQFDIAHVDGLDKSIEKLLAIGRGDRSIYLFLLDLLRYVVPGLNVLRKVLGESAIFVGGSLDEQIARSLSQLPTNVLTVLEEVSRYHMGEEVGNLKLGVRHAIGGGICRLIVARARSGSSDQINVSVRTSKHSWFYGMLGRHLTVLSSDNMDVLLKMQHKGLIALETYLEVAGGNALVSVASRGGSSWAKPVPGPLLGSLQGYFLPDPERSVGQWDLFSQLYRVAHSSESLVPLHASIVRMLLAFFSMVTVEQIESTFPRTTDLQDTRRARGGYGALCIATICAAYDTGQDWTPAVRSMPSQAGSTALRKLQTRSGLTRLELGGELLLALERLEVGTGWRNVIRGWQRGELPIGYS